MAGPPFHSQPFMSSDAWAADSADDLGEIGGRYIERGLLGIGGMGKVLVAYDPQLRREVAVKIARSPVYAKRMAREARITANLEHPSIVPVYDAGRNDEGLPIYVMRLIRGRTLEEKIAQAPEVHDRLDLIRSFGRACEAVAYAHAMGVIHRDLKPSNILVGEFGETQVVDWGLAKPLDADSDMWSDDDFGDGLTGHGQVVGTPSWMSPEQARGEPADTRSDVWSLGMILLQILSGRTPFAARGDELLGALRRNIAPRFNVPEEVPTDLLAIARRALHPVADERYPSALEFAADLQAWLDGRKVRAHDYTSWEVVGRLVEKHRPVLLAFLTAVIAIVGIGLLAAIRTAQDRDRAVAARAAADDALVAARNSLAHAMEEQALRAQISDRRPEAEILAATSLRHGESPLARGVLASFAGSERPTMSLRIDLPEECRNRHEPSQDGTLLACWRDDRLVVYRMSTWAELWRSDVPVLFVTWHVDGRLAVRTEDRHFRMYSPDGDIEIDAFAFRGGRVAPVSGEPPLVIRDAHGWEVYNPHTGDTKRIPNCEAQNNAVGAEGLNPIIMCEDGTLMLFNPQGELTDSWVLGTEADGFTFVEKTGAQVLAASVHGSVMLFDAELGQLARRDDVGSPVLSILRVPETDFVLVQGERGGPRIWDIALNRWAGSLPSGADEMFSDGTPGVVYLTRDHLEKWKFPVSMRPWRMEHDAGFSSVVFDPSGEHLGWADGSGRIGVYSVEEGRNLAVFAWQTGVAKSATFSADGKELIGAGMRARGAHVFDWRTGELKHKSKPRVGSHFRRLGTLKELGYWGMGYAPYTGVFDQETGEEVRWFGTHEYVDGSSSANSERAAFLDPEGFLWSISPAGRANRVGQIDNARAIDISDDGWIVAANDRKVCYGESFENCVEPEGYVLDVSVSGDGQWFAASTLEGEIFVYRRTGELRGVLRGHSARVNSIDFSPDGSLLASTGWGYDIRLWDMRMLVADARDLIAEVEHAWDTSIGDVIP